MLKICFLRPILATRKYAYILPGTFKHTCIVSTFAYWWLLCCVWAFVLLPNVHIFLMGNQKHIHLMTAARKYPHILHGTVGSTYVFFTFAPGLLLLRVWVSLLLANMHIFCMGPSNTHVCSLLLRIVGHFFVCGLSSLPGSTGSCVAPPTLTPGA